MQAQDTPDGATALRLLEQNPPQRDDQADREQLARVAWALHAAVEELSVGNHWRPVLARWEQAARGAIGAFR